MPIKTNQESLKKAFIELGVERGDTLEVHSSLSRFGHVEGGAPAVVNALMAAVGPEGSIIMSAFRLSKPLPLTLKDHKNEVNLKLKVLSEQTKARSGMGIIVDEFLQRENVITSNGMFRLAAWGKKSKKLIDDGFKEVVNNKGKALLLGVNYDRCSSLHLSEDIKLPEEITNYFMIPDQIKKQYSANFYIGYRDTLEVHFNKAGKEAEQLGIVQIKHVGDAKCRLFSPKAMVEILRTWRKKSPYKFCHDNNVKTK